MNIQYCGCFLLGKKSSLCQDWRLVTNRLLKGRTQKEIRKVVSNLEKRAKKWRSPVVHECGDAFAIHSPKKKTKPKIKEFCQNIRRSGSKFAWNQTFSDIYVSKRITLDTLCLLILLFINTQVYYTICARWTETYISPCRVSHRKNIAQVMCVATRQNIKEQYVKDTTITASFRFLRLY